MDILTIQNKKDEKFLRRKTGVFDFSKFTKKEIKELLEKMRKTMKAADGVGLSANQVGLNLRLFVAEVPSQKGRSKFYAIFNPEIEGQSEKLAMLSEGCLSVPGLFGAVERSDKITLKGFDAQGKKIKIKAWGFLARVFQHEVDHLNGKLFIDKAKFPRSMNRE
ncbi:MAG: peptide deformylase [Candidatus Harrisonbacteria bacterium RIFCSPHIGHO2_01_FULL_44_13]|uniref:Peptide deformylase n=1 Tax=Candidatus Harrisonbacteria bacterium RIFCSPLOWO2_01_FULL_44_18 TaxID=1798407 RepID=A0A1G1ZMZ3_9BACT|nr:MAG: peptide deformylase [Candidatus Harrisonbacteria bacterium RIFCSPHIGHO2_01_FULL_44_13]OGY65982.1 MAG: peptide deformylase [Candidatus Harrisonbacteria bacterium RIFCSPLOWO2_01_FULL_44_18]